MEQPVSSGQTSSCETETQATFRSHKDVFGDVDSNWHKLHGGPSGLAVKILMILHPEHFDAVGP